MKALRAAKKPVDHCGRRRALLGSVGRRLRISRHAMAFRSARRRRANHRCPSPMNSTWARSASPARLPSNALCEDADVVLAVGTRLQDFTTGSWALFKKPRVRRSLASTRKCSMPRSTGRLPLIADARAGLEELSADLGSYKAPDSLDQDRQGWFRGMDEGGRRGDRRRPMPLPSDAQVDRRRAARDGPRHSRSSVPPGGLPGEMHKLWQASYPSSYHMEYGFSCMGYEIAGGLGMKMAQPERDVVVMVGDGSYLMMNSELATSVMLGHENHRGACSTIAASAASTGCRTATGGERFNNLFEYNTHAGSLPGDRFRGPCAKPRRHCREGRVASPNWKAPSRRPRAMTARTVIVIDTDPMISTEAGGHWWDVRGAGSIAAQGSRRRRARNMRDARKHAARR